MPSAALIHWQTDRMVRLGLVDAQCAAVMGSPAPSIPPTSLPPLAEESLGGYVMLVSGHFQGFCRDLYTECTQILTASLPIGFRDALQTQCMTELKLNSGNPTIENIRKDFERFEFKLDLAHAGPSGRIWVTDLGHLNQWRNTVAHQKPNLPPTGVPNTPILANVRTWRAACDGLATSLDDIMNRELSKILGVSPW